VQSGNKRREIETHRSISAVTTTAQRCQVTAVLVTTTTTSSSSSRSWSR